MSEELDEKETLETTTEEVEKTEQVEGTTPEVETEDLEKLKEQNKRLFERAKKAEAKLKEKPPTQTTNPPNTDADELKLIARGYSDEAIDQAKVIAKGTNKSLSEAIKSPLFEAFLEKQKAEERKEKARLNASKGSGQETQKSMSDLSRPEHQALAMEAAKNIQ